jgi:hypothetical protein
MVALGLRAAGVGGIAPESVCAARRVGVGADVCPAGVGGGISPGGVRDAGGVGVGADVCPAGVGGGISPGGVRDAGDVGVSGWRVVRVRSISGI